ncbi:type 4b pilus protein PilO2 [Paenalcaligenes hominis]|uniref:hypothetical protein n=1 Tax=Paenalcaligenes hominis TaxID=643674 RepID=UPI0035256CEC
MSHEHIHVCSHYQLVFGLRWFPILGASSTQQARVLSKQYRARASVLIGRHFMCLGLSQKELKQKTTRLSAAVCFAYLFPRGVHAAIYQLADQLYWLVVVHEGTPIRQGDLLFQSLDQAQQRAQEFKKHYSTLVLQAEARSIQALLPLINPRIRVKAQLKPLRHRSWAWVGLLIVGLGSFYWSYTPRVSVAAIEPPVVIPDPYITYWEQQRRPASNQKALQALLQHWQQLPLSVAQWDLTTSSCQVQREAWHCAHEFKPATETATVVDFQQNRPEPWAVTQANLQRIQVQVAIAFNSTETRLWHSSHTHQHQFLAQLQRLKPAFQNMTLKDPVLYGKQALEKNRTQTLTDSQLAQPQPIFEQALSLQGPLRSTALLLDFDDRFYWEKASLTVNRKIKPSLKHSVLETQLNGVTYVRN